MGRRNRILLREQYLQNLENEQRTDHTISNDNPNITAPVSGIRRSSRKRFFQNLDAEGTSADFEDGRAYESGELDESANSVYTNYREKDAPILLQRSLRKQFSVGRQVT